MYKQDNNKGMRITEGVVDNRHQPNKYMSYEAKRIIIMNDIAMNMPYQEICDKYSELWGLSSTTVHRLLECIKADMDKGVVQSQIKELNTHRTNEIINRALESENDFVALKAIDMQNKTAGVYAKNEVKEDKDVVIKVNLEF